ncbi:TetR/AcrR family transcriptional regulator [Pseudonocardia sp. TRM90224]|uniref:TetR/AcrR family transcriptional regulator n=1 Tax=Pseudonocardia sp. TRM90224 TaxID=2812678 RepID=UPI001E53B2E6|nr:TetR/AcrR family transcriptional regulator [Pseudonocardia sp. TRM90224]
MRTVDPVRHAESRKRILDGAAEAFAAKGYAKTTVADLRRATQVSSGSLFHYFADKGAIFRGVVEEDCRKVTERLATIDETEPLTAFWAAVDVLIGDLGDPKAAGLTVAMLERIPADSEIAVILGRYDAAVLDLLAGLARRLQQADRMDRSISPLRVARWVLGMIDGLYLHCADDGFDSRKEARFLQLVIGRTFQVQGSATGKESRAPTHDPGEGARPAAP